MKNKKLLSLKKSLNKMIILYWLVPVLLIVLSLSFYSNVQIKNGFLEEISAHASSSSELSQKILVDLVQESKQATYDKILDNVYNEYKNSKDKLNLYRGTSSYLKNKYEYNHYISESILLYHNVQDEIYYSNGYNQSWSFVKIKNFVKDNYYNLMSISEEIETYVEFIVIDNELFLIRNLVDSNYDPFAIIIFRIDKNAVFEKLTNLTFVEEIALKFHNYDVVVSEKNSEINLYDYGTDEKVLKVSKDYYLYQNSYNTSDFSTSYNVLINTHILNQDYIALAILVIIVTILIIPLLIFAVHFFHKHFDIPVRALIHSANNIENGKLGYQISKEPQSVEFEYLFERFNTMSTSMKEQVDFIYKEQEAVQNAKIKALQSQINPHFLNNTLEVINWEMRLGETENAIEMIESLSTMLNASTARNEKKLRYLNEELVYVNAYLHIVQTRMGKRLTVIKEIDESVTKYQVPLLILQPVVENAIEHGIGERASGTVTIRVYEEHENLVIEVENDNSLSEKDKKRIDKLLNWNGEEEEGHISQTSLGIRNVNERIKLIFGKQYSLTIKSTKENGTISKIIIPKT